MALISGAEPVRLSLLLVGSQGRSSELCCPDSLSLSPDTSRAAVSAPLEVTGWRNACPCPQTMALLSVHGLGSGSWLPCSENGNCSSGALLNPIPTCALSPNKRSSVRRNYSSNITVLKCRWSPAPGKDLELGSNNSPTAG